MVNISPKVFSPMISTPLVDYAQGIHKLKSQKTFYKKHPFLNPNPATVNHSTSTELIVKSFISPEFARKHPKVTGFLYNLFPPVLPKIVDVNLQEGKKLYKETSLSPYQFKEFSIKMRLKYEKLLKKAAMR